MSVLSTQIVGYALATPAANVRVTQIVIQGMAVPVPNMRSTQLTVTVIVNAEPIYLATGTHPSTPMRATQIVLLIMIPNWSVAMPAVFPTLPGLTYPVHKRPKWDTIVNRHASGREVRIGLWQYPLWEFDLQFDWLPDYNNLIDLRRLIGFFNNAGGARGAFLYQDPSDFYVTNQAIGTGDAFTTNWTIVRTYGGTIADEQFTEPVGWVDLTAVLKVYLNGVEQLSSTYTIIQNTMVQNQIQFHTPPASGAAITMSFGFYYAVRFAEDMIEFDEIVNAIWQQKKLTLMSIREQ